MTFPSLLQVGIYIGVLVGLSLPLGYYMAQVYRGRRTLLSPLTNPLENIVYKLCDVDPKAEMSWVKYARSMLIFNVAGLLLLYGLQRLQNLLPLNPEKMPPVPVDTAFNAAIAFVTNTCWQSYGGETTLSYLTQMLGMNVQGFLSAGTGMALLAAFLRGFTRQESSTIGNFWQDLVRSIVHIFLPLSLVLSLAMVFEGVPQTLAAYQSFMPLEQAGRDATGTRESMKIALGPVASQVAIKIIGTNGGGFFNANSAHPFENPTPLSNFVQMLAILLIPAALCHTFGTLVLDRRQGWAIFSAMAVIFAFCLGVVMDQEMRGNPALSELPIDFRTSDINLGGNMEGKELRFGVANSALWATATTAAAAGAVNSMLDSYAPLSGLPMLLLLQTGQVVFGGVGSGLYGMLLYAIATVFLAGLMVGRAPEYLHKKVDAFEIKMASLFIIIPPILVLGGTALALSTQAGTGAILNPGPHGLSEILYAFSSACYNNGSAFAGLDASIPFYNYALGIGAFIARFWLAIAVLAVAGSLALKRVVPAGPGTLRTDDSLFVILLIGIVLVLFTVLTYIPALALGPIAEQLHSVAN